MPPLMFHHFSGHLPRTRKLCKFCKMMDQNFQTKPINPAKKILVICLGKTVFPLTLPKHFRFCRNCQTDCFHFQQFLPMVDIFSYMFTTAKTTAMDARRHEAKKALLYAKNQEPPWGQVQGGQQEQPRLLKLPFLFIKRVGRR